MTHAEVESMGLGFRKPLRISGLEPSAVLSRVLSKWRAGGLSAAPGGVREFGQLHLHDCSNSIPKFRLHLPDQLAKSLCELASCHFAGATSELGRGHPRENPVSPETGFPDPSPTVTA